MGSYGFHRTLLPARGHVNFAKQIYMKLCNLLILPKNITKIILKIQKYPPSQTVGYSSQERHRR